MHSLPGSTAVLNVSVLPVTETLVVSAHLDDAVLSCYSVLGPETTVLTVFAGFPPAGTLGKWDADGGAADSQARVAERREEDRLALERSGAAFVHLDLPDAQYVNAGIAERPSLESLSASLREKLAGVTTVLAPCALSAKRPFDRFRPRRHSDHRFVRDAALAARPDATLYADLPYALHPGTGGYALPGDVDGSNRDERRVTLEPDLVAEKIAAVRCYATQIRQLEESFGDFLTPAGLGLEVYWPPRR
jgi:LmbE family N-acetylglucosaminyl deacetylase